MKWFREHPLEICILWGVIQPLIVLFIFFIQSSNGFSTNFQQLFSEISIVEILSTTILILFHTIPFILLGILIKRNLTNKTIDKISSSLRGGLIGATLGLLGTSLFFDILGSGISNDGQIGLVFVFFPCYGTIAVGVGYGIGILFSKIKKSRIWKR